MPSARSDHLQPVLARAPRYEIPLLAIVVTTLLIPATLVRNLDILVVLCPILIGLGIPLGINRERPAWIPTWVTYDLLSVLVVIYGAYIIGTVLPWGLVAIAIGAFAMYDMFAVRRGEQMEEVSLLAFKYGLPVAVLLPNSETFEFAAFREVVRQGSLAPTFGEGPAGCTILGVIDLTFPGALAVAISKTATVHLGLFTVSLPALGVIGGTAIGFAVLLYLDFDEPVGVPTAVMPGALLGLLAVLYVTGRSVASLGAP